MKIRTFTESDRSTLQVVYLESRKQYFTWLNTSKFVLSDFDRDTKGEIIWVATDTNRAIGFISVWKADNFIHNLFISPDFIGCGIGTKLLKKCLTKIARPATLKCSKANTKAREFYLSRGWQIISEGESLLGEYELMNFNKEI